jgi:hypothetical protein
MEPGFGWTLLSRGALRRADLQLREDVEGVRDEVGFLELHQAYADRFFPGTSVLHTRLRYALFVPWMYDAMSQDPERHRMAALIERREIALAGRLKAAGEQGVIGGRRFPQPASQPPSMVYWSALGAWRILRPLSDGSYPSRQMVTRAIARKPSRQRLQDDDGQLIVEDEPVFCSIPSPPASWHDASAHLDFCLTTPERRFLTTCLLSVARDDESTSPSLLARLVEKRVGITPQTPLWAAKIRDVADDPDRAALVRARQCAALAAIGRAVYAAMVEHIRTAIDGLPTEDVHRSALPNVIDEHRREAAALDIEAVRLDAPTISQGILDLLRATQSWLKSDAQLTDLFDIYERGESTRKGRRARLTKSLRGRERRAEWRPKDTALSEPLHYRWGNVRRLLLDLGDVE